MSTYYGGRSTIDFMEHVLTVEDVGLFKVYILSSLKNPLSKQYYIVFGNILLSTGYYGNYVFEGDVQPKPCKNRIETEAWDKMLEESSTQKSHTFSSSLADYKVSSFSKEQLTIEERAWLSVLKKNVDSDVAYNWILSNKPVTLCAEFSFDAYQRDRGLEAVYDGYDAICSKLSDLL
jgi:hypothetical protein